MSQVPYRLDSKPDAWDACSSAVSNEARIPMPEYSMCGYGRCAPMRVMSRRDIAMSSVRTSMHAANITAAVAETKRLRFVCR